MSMTDPIIKPIELAPDTFEVRSYPKVASGAWSKGDLLYLDAAGRVNLCADSPGKILGVALKATLATEAVDTQIPVAVITSQTKITASVGTTTVPIAAGVLDAVVGDTRILYKSAAGKWAVGEADAVGTASFIITDRAEDPPNGALVYRAVGKLDSQVLQSAFESTTPVVLNYRGAIAAADLTQDASNILVAVPTGKKARVVDIQMQAVGGTVTGATSVDIVIGTNHVGVAAAANLVIASPVRLDGTAGVAALPSGASFTLQGDGEDICMVAVGGAVATATYVIAVVTYVLENA